MIRGLFFLTFCISLVSASQKVSANQIFPSAHGIQFQKSFQQPVEKNIPEEQSEESNDSDYLFTSIVFENVSPESDYLPRLGLCPSILNSWQIDEMFVRGPPVSIGTLA